jgi:prepilin-type N-terminal cleavage/methylation domain-containing protein
MKHDGQQAGFTLLELLIVVSILSATAYVTLNTLDNNNNQHRYNDSFNRLDIIKRAVVGKPSNSYVGGARLAGYVADNGVLPTAFASLLQTPIDFQAYGVKAPHFDSDPDSATGINDDAGTILNEAQYLLPKGYRSSGYIRQPAGSDGYADGFGYPWSETVTATTFFVATLGLDNRADVDSDASGSIEDGELVNPYDRDHSILVGGNDWLIDVAGWQVNVINGSSTDIIATSGQCLRLSLLIFQNYASTDASNPRWKRLTSDCISGTISDSARTCLDGDGDGLVTVDAVPESCPTNTVVAFPALGGGIGSFQPPTEIPAGEHLLVLVADTLSTDAHNDSSESVDGRQISSRVTFYADLGRPNVELQIR